MAFTSYGKLHAGFNSCRNLYLDSLTLSDKTGTTTAAAWIADDLAFSVTLRAGAVCHGAAEE